MGQRPLLHTYFLKTSFYLGVPAPVGASLIFAVLGLSCRSESSNISLVVLEANTGKTSLCHMETRKSKRERTKREVAIFAVIDKRGWV